jgi:protein involved in polysaccharide export with SLBB domain
LQDLRLPLIKWNIASLKVLNKYFYIIKNLLNRYWILFGEQMKHLTILILTTFWIVGCSAPNHLPSVPNDRHVYEEKVQYFSHDYMISAGDQIEVSYHIDVRKQDKYEIAVGDQIRIEFAHYPHLDRTLNVRPDGRITLPQVGDIMAFGYAPMSLAAEISKKYVSTLRNPASTVSLIRFGENIRELKQTIKTSTRGQSRLVLVQPDGRISVPLLKPIRVAGMRIEGIQKTINTEYKKMVSGMFTSVTLIQATGNRIYVMGAVQNPGFFQLVGPTTVSQGIAMAQGFQHSAATKEVLLISRDEKGHAVGKIINMYDILKSGNIGLDSMLRQADIIYVPDTTLSRAGIFMDNIYQLIPFTLTANYQLNNQN